MSAKGVQFTIRLNNEVNEQIVDIAKEMDVTRAQLIRVAVEDYLEPKTGSNPNPPTEGTIKYLESELEEKNKQINQLLTQLDQNQQIIMSMNQNQKLLVESKQTWFHKLFGLAEST